MGLVLAVGAGKEGQQTSQAALLALSSVPSHSWHSIPAAPECQDARQGSRNPSPLASAERGLCCLLGTRNIHPLLVSPRLWQIVSPLSVLCTTRDTEPAAEGVSGWLQPHLLWSVQGRRDGSAPCQGSHY